MSEAQLKTEVDKLTENQEGMSKAIAKAKTFEYIATRSRIAIDRDDIFQDKLFGRDMIEAQQWTWESEIIRNKLEFAHANVSKVYECGTYRTMSDFGHTSPNSKLLLGVGFTGLLDRINKYYKNDALTQKQKEFYESCKIYPEAVLCFIKRIKH